MLCLSFPHGFRNISNTIYNTKYNTKYIFILMHHADVRLNHNETDLFVLDITLHNHSV